LEYRGRRGRQEQLAQQDRPEPKDRRESRDLPVLTGLLVRRVRKDHKALKAIPARLEQQEHLVRPGQPAHKGLKAFLAQWGRP
jgi:hypothetical protein